MGDAEQHNAHRLIGQGELQSAQRIARAGLLGWTLAPEGEGFLAGRWGQTQILADVPAVEKVFRQIGVIA